MVNLMLPYPPSVNHYWRHARGRTYVSAKGTSYRAAVQAATTLAAPSNAPLLGRLTVYVCLRAPDRRRRDIDNACKALLDALAHAGAYKDDSQIDYLIVERGDIIKGGMAVVVIEEMKS